jgi:CBS domain-containing protein
LQITCRLSWEYAPFKYLSFDELAAIATNIRVLNLEVNKTLLVGDDPLHDVFYVVASGLVNLTVIVDAEKYFEQMS